MYCSGGNSILVSTSSSFIFAMALSLGDNLRSLAAMSIAKWVSGSMSFAFCLSWRLVSMLDRHSNNAPSPSLSPCLCLFLVLVVCEVELCEVGVCEVGVCEGGVWLGGG